MTTIRHFSFFLILCFCLSGSLQQAAAAPTKMRTLRQEVRHQVKNFYKLRLTKGQNVKAAAVDFSRAVDATIKAALHSSAIIPVTVGLASISALDAAARVSGLSRDSNIVRNSVVTAGAPIVLGKASYTWAQQAATHFATGFSKLLWGPVPRQGNPKK